MRQRKRAGVPNVLDTLGKRCLECTLGIIGMNSGLQR